MGIIHDDFLSPKIMNTSELYKKLPKTNCGRCAQKMYLPFALSAIKGDADLLKNRNRIVIIR